MIIFTLFYHINMFQSRKHLKFVKKLLAKHSRLKYELSSKIQITISRINGFISVSYIQKAMIQQEIRETFYLIGNAIDIRNYGKRMTRTTHC